MNSVTDFTNQDEAKRWLESKPREIGIVFAARAALRVAPILVLPFIARYDAARLAEEVVLPATRAMAASWVAGRYLIREDEESCRSDRECGSRRQGCEPRR